MLVLIGTLELHDIGLAGQMVHDLDLPPDVLDVLLVDQLPLGDRLAGKLLASLLVGAQVGDPELPPAELLPNRVHRLDLLHGTAEDRADGARLGGLGA